MQQLHDTHLHFHAVVGQFCRVRSKHHSFKGRSLSHDRQADLRTSSTPLSSTTVRGCQPLAHHIITIIVIVGVIVVVSLAGADRFDN